MVAGEVAEGNPDGNRCLAPTMCEIIADAKDNPKYHSKQARCARTECYERELTITASF